MSSTTRLCTSIVTADSSRSAMEPWPRSPVRVPRCRNSGSRGKPEPSGGASLKLRRGGLGDRDAHGRRVGAAVKDADERRSFEEGERAILIGACLERAVTHAGHVGSALGASGGMFFVVEGFAVELHADDECTAAVDALWQ